MIGKIYNTLIFTCLLLLTPFNIFAQQVACAEQLKKSIPEKVKIQLLPALDSLVVQIRKNQLSDNMLWKKEAKFTTAIFEDIHFYESSYLDSSSVTSNTLLNCYPVGEDRYLCQIAYFKQENGSSKSLQMLLSILAHVAQDAITFSTPLSYYTSTWNEKKVGDINYYYKHKFSLDRAEKFAQKNVLFAARFKKYPQLFDFYMVENYQEIIKLMGFDYNAKSIGKLSDGYGVIADKCIFSVMNNEDFSHDLFHYYSGTVHHSTLRNWVAEEGLAYSWGNAYYTKKDGEMAEQKELLMILKQYLVRNKEIDLLQLFEHNFWSDKSGIYEHLGPNVKVGRLIASLICDEVKQQHGMEGINQLIACGTKPNQFDPFFAVTDKLIGLNRKNFTKKIRSLIKEIK